MSKLCKYSIGEITENEKGEKYLCCRLFGEYKNIDHDECLANCGHQEPIAELSLEDIAFLLAKLSKCESCPFQKKCTEGGGGTDMYHCENTFYEWLKLCEELRGEA